MGVKAILATLPYKVKAETEQEIWRDYMAKCARLCTENTAGFTQGQYLTVEYEDIIHKKPQIKQKQGEATEKIRAKLR
jgi:hypothetical protein